MPPMALAELLAKGFKDQWEEVWGDCDEGGQARALGSEASESHCTIYCAWRTPLPPLLPFFFPEEKGIKMGAIIVPTAQDGYKD